MRDDKRDDRFLILKELLDLVDSIQTLRLPLHILRLILVVVVLLADQQLLLEALLRVLVGSASGSVTWLSVAAGGARLARAGSAR